MRKITALVLAAQMALSLSACGSSATSSPDTTETSSQTQQSNTENTTENGTEAESNSEEAESGNQNKVLILYFSANNTKDVDAIWKPSGLILYVNSARWKHPKS